jgi:hypothetical protein
MERLRLLWEVNGRYEESLGAREVIGRQEKVICCYESP